MKSFAVAALASVVSAWGYQQPIKGHGIGLGYAQSGVGVYGDSSIGLGKGIGVGKGIGIGVGKGLGVGLGVGKGLYGKGGYNSIGGGQSANALRATL